MCVFVCVWKYAVASKDLFGLVYVCMLNKVMYMHVYGIIRSRLDLLCLFDGGYYSPAAVVAFFQSQQQQHSSIFIVVYVCFAV